MTTQRKVGRPHLGPRKRVPLKMPVVLADRLAEEAERLGTTVNSMVNEWAAEKLGVPYPYPRQETLPLQEAS